MGIKTVTIHILGARRPSSRFRERWLIQIFDNAQYPIVMTLGNSKLHRVQIWNELLVYFINFNTHPLIQDKF